MEAVRGAVVLLYTYFHTLFLPNVEKKNSVTIKVSADIGLGTVCKQLRSQEKWLCYLEKAFCSVKKELILPSISYK